MALSCWLFGHTAWSEVHGAGLQTLSSPPSHPQTRELCVFLLHLLQLRAAPSVSCRVCVATAPLALGFQRAGATVSAADMLLTCLFCLHPIPFTMSQARSACLVLLGKKRFQAHSGAPAAPEQMPG